MARRCGEGSAPHETDYKTEGGVIPRQLDKVGQRWWIDFDHTTVFGDQGFSRQGDETLTRTVHDLGGAGGQGVSM